MICCVRTSREAACNYGELEPPACPLQPPATSDSCGPTPFACRYPDSCPELTAYCNGKLWERIVAPAIAGSSALDACQVGGAGGAP